MPLVYVLVNTEPSQMESVLEKIKEIGGIEEAYMVYGTYDILVKVKTEIQKELKGIVQKIRSQDNVLSTLTLTAIKE
ncbi:Lrp/AsnC ligand binding domain-containing protein [Candidatus Bathyarchaeota archaeon]|nr:Lrp/AsnC ligand binding domain-containing protein [Candidatus Bathyarchaeota archaeon]